MKTSPLVLVILSATLAACATQEPPKPAPPAPAPAPAPKPQAAPELKPVAKPEPKPEPKKPAVVNLSSSELFEFNKATLTDEANQKLSEKRAEAVRAYLISKGVDAAKVETFGFGKTTPVKSCPDQKNRSALIECLAPNRRVEVEIQGTPR